MDPELFHPQRKGSSASIARAAKAVCAACPVRDDCYRWAMSDPTLLGVMGGTTADERRQTRQTERAANRTTPDLGGRPPAPEQHGTVAGAWQHIRRGEPPCGPCRTARATYNNTFKAVAS
jgi:WhiB family redox-sensing transcriptional regulator